jgi:hypothetical protein
MAMTIRDRNCLVRNIESHIVLAEPCPDLRPQLRMRLVAHHRSEMSGRKDQIGLVVAPYQVYQGKA